MTVQTIDTQQVNQAVDLREYAGAYTTLHRESAQELAGPCPKCGGRDRFHVTADWFICRQCHPKRGSAIEFTMWREGLDFRQAVAMLTNAPTPAPATQRRPAPKPAATQAPDWQRDALNIANHAHWRLRDDTDAGAQAARAYLDSRGLEPQTWIAFRLGYAPRVAIPGTEGKERAPAISMPWYRAGQVVGIRYRFLEKQGDHKQTALAGSQFAGALYGGQALLENIPELSTLLICEGELNGASIWQVAKDSHLDVFSLGSESATITPAMVAHAARYATVITWLDREDYVKKAMATLPGADRGIKSPNGQDANDLLQAGRLGAFLALHRFQAAQNREQQQRLLWDLSDAAQLWPGADPATLKVIEHIKGGL